MLVLAISATQRRPMPMSIWRQMAVNLMVSWFNSVDLSRRCPAAAVSDTINFFIFDWLNISVYLSACTSVSVWLTPCDSFIGPVRWFVCPVYVSIRQYACLSHRLSVRLSVNASWPLQSHPLHRLHRSLSVVSHKADHSLQPSLPRGAPATCWSNGSEGYCSVSALPSYGHVLCHDNSHYPLRLASVRWFHRIFF